jgi:hypothetical protein
MFPKYCGPNLQLEGVTISCLVRTAEGSVRVIQEESSVFVEMTVSVMGREKVHMHVCLSTR